jgi:hypothetical protein
MQNFRIAYRHMKQRYNVEDLHVDARMILKWILKKSGGTPAEFIWLRSSNCFMETR